MLDPGSSPSASKLLSRRQARGGKICQRLRACDARRAVDRQKRAGRGNPLPALHNLSGGFGGNGLRPWSVKDTPASRVARLSFRHNTVMSLSPVEGIEGSTWVMKARGRGCPPGFRSGERAANLPPGSGEVHGEALEIGERAVLQRTFVGRAQDHAGRLAGLECLLPAGCTQAPAVAGLEAAKANCGIGVERSLPRDLENSRNAAVMTTQTVWLPMSSCPVSQQPSR